CEFILDYEEDDEESGRRKKPWRYRWPDEPRDEVLARLLDLNQRRARDEQLAGAKEGKRAVRSSRPRGRRRTANAAQGSLLPEPKDQAVPDNPPRTSLAVRDELVDAMVLDLVGPLTPAHPLRDEVLPQAPSRWYLTGFLVPVDAGAEQRTDTDS